MNTKYEITDIAHPKNPKLRRIRALVAIGSSVFPGQFGGYIESEKNLSVSGNAWVSGSAQVSGSARVYGSAQVSGTARVYDNARVYGTAQVYDNVWVSGTAQVHGSAQVYGSAWVYGSAQVYGSAWVYGSAQVHGNARVSGKARASITPTVVSGLRWDLTISDHHLAAGCQCHTFEEWRMFAPEQIAKMAVGATEFYPGMMLLLEQCLKMRMTVPLPVGYGSTESPAIDDARGKSHE
jgi:cytoskeletal protein CcmA (bactofilin family)